MVGWSPQHEELYVSVVELGELITYALEDRVIMFYDKNMLEDVKTL